MPRYAAYAAATPLSYFADADYAIRALRAHALRWRHGRRGAPAPYATSRLFTRLRAIYGTLAPYAAYASRHHDTNASAYVIDDIR